MDILNGKRLILASKSPRRDEILTMAGLAHEIFVSGADEASVAYIPGKSEAYVEAISRLKASCVSEAWRGERSGVVFLAADTAVYAPETGEALGKPRDRADAYRMLRLLSGGRHQVVTGYTAELDGERRTGYVSTDVWFRELTDEEIYDYIDVAAPYDKAGAYGIQERASIFVSRIDGDYFNIMGLPIERVYVTLRELCRR